MASLVLLFPIERDEQDGAEAEDHRAETGEDETPPAAALLRIAMAQGVGEAGVDQTFAEPKPDLAM